MMQVRRALIVSFITLVMTTVQLQFASPVLADGLLSPSLPASGQSGQLSATPNLGLEQATRILPVEEAFRFGSYVTADGVQIFWQVQPGYYLYRDKISVVSDGQTLTPTLPAGLWRDDEIFGEVLVLEGLVETLIPGLSMDQKPLQVRFQGCAAKGYCYPPQEIELTSSINTPNSVKM